jgi:hypothetical protein
MIEHRALIILAAARNKVPAVYSQPAYARGGGLLSYGPDQVDTWRRAATYVDRILRSEKPGDLPVQFPTKFEMVVNRKTAKALGLTVPQSILLRSRRGDRIAIPQRKKLWLPMPASGQKPPTVQRQHVSFPQLRTFSETRSSLARIAIGAAIPMPRWPSARPIDTGRRAREGPGCARTGEGVRYPGPLGPL